VTSDRRSEHPTLEPSHPLFGLGYAKPIEHCAFLRSDDDGFTEVQATVAAETPVALVYNGWPHVVMMCTPADIEDFALGFTLTEEIVKWREEIGPLRAVRYSQGIEVELSLPESASDALRQRGRSLVRRTGCGLCGVTPIDDALVGAFRESGAIVERVNGHMVLSVNDLQHLNALVDAARSRGAVLSELSPLRSTLEDVFVDLIRATDVQVGATPEVQS